MSAGLGRKESLPSHTLDPATSDQVHFLEPRTDNEPEPEQDLERKSSKTETASHLKLYLKQEPRLEPSAETGTENTPDTEHNGTDQRPGPWIDADKESSLKPLQDQGQQSGEQIECPPEPLQDQEHLLGPEHTEHQHEPNQDQDQPDKDHQPEQLIETENNSSLDVDLDQEVREEQESEIGVLEDSEEEPEEQPEEPKKEPKDEPEEEPEEEHVI